MFLALKRSEVLTDADSGNETRINKVNTERE
jgi:hypothetical protein